jgi:NAD(P)-dependent dehydrogenase (short-subunit alcohol dehydrogenase family)
MQNYRQLFDLGGKTAVVLGAASGIGQASAHALGALGAHVVCADRDADGAQATAEQITQSGAGSAEWRSTDAASGADIAALAAHRPGREPEPQRCLPLHAPLRRADDEAGKR